MAVDRGLNVTDKWVDQATKEQNAMFAIGRKRLVNFAISVRFEHPHSGKADIRE